MSDGRGQPCHVVMRKGDDPTEFRTRGQSSRAYRAGIDGRGMARSRKVSGRRDEPPAAYIPEGSGPIAQPIRALMGIRIRPGPVLLPLAGTAKPRW